MERSSRDTDLPLLVVISTPGSTRGDHLKSQLNANSGFRVHILDAVMVSDFSQIQESGIDVTRMSKGLLRPVLPNEIGCSISHNLARKIISEDALGGAILEDDVQIDSVTALLEVTSAFLETQKNVCSVLSLTTTLGRNISEGLSNKVTRFYRLIGTPALAQGYVLTPDAARVLIEANTPVRHLADWPISGAKFFTSNRKTVGQPADIPLSTIDPDGNKRGRGVEALQRKILMYFGIYYLTNSQYFESINSYFREIVLHRVFHHVDRLLIRIYTLKEYFK